MIRVRLSVLLAVLTGALLVAPAPAVARAPGDDFKWSVVPSSPTGPTVRSRFEYGLKPGEEVADWVAVSNLGKKALKVSVYATDAFNAADGGFALLPASQPPKDVGSWITLPRKEYIVPVGKRVDIPFKVKIPANAEPGDHIGGLIASATENTTNEQGQQVNVERRVAARVYLRVDGPVQPVAQITRVDVEYANPTIPFGGGEMTVTYHVANTGNVRFSGKSRIQVKGPLGMRVANSDVIDIPELLPDSEIRITRMLEGVFPAGHLTAEVTVNPQMAGRGLPSLAESRSMWAVPWLIVIALALVAAAFAVLLWRRRSNRRMDAEAELVGAREPVGARAIALAAVAVAALAVPGVREPGPEEVEVQVSIGPAVTASPSPSVSPSPSETPTPEPSGSVTPPPGGGGGGDLPRTGIALGAFVAVGAALVGGGAGLRVLGRRRRAA